MTRNKRFHSRFCQQLVTDGSSFLLSARKPLYLPSAQKCPQDNNLCLLTAGASASLTPWRHGAPSKSPSLSALGRGGPDHAPVWVCPGIHRHGYGWSSARKGFGYLPFLPWLIAEPERSRHPASSCSVSGFLGNLPCCDSSNITGTARTKPLKEEIPSPF